jgi:hypothetical protein
VRRAALAAALLLLAASPAAAQFSSSFPGDVGIEGDSRVCFTEKFTGTAAQIFARFSQGSTNQATMTTPGDAPPNSPVAQSLMISGTGGGAGGGTLYKNLAALAPAACTSTTKWLRVMIKHSAAGNLHHTGPWWIGQNPPSEFMISTTGRPAGNDRFYVGNEPTPDNGTFTASPILTPYAGWVGMHALADGTTFIGNTVTNGPAESRGAWHTLEVGIGMNSPVTTSNGFLQIYWDGSLVIDLTQGAAGSWNENRFTMGGGGTFEGFQWRTDANLTVNGILLNGLLDQNPGGTTSTVQYAHLVVANARVGPLVAQGGGGGAVSLVTSNSASGASNQPAATIAPAGTDRLLSATVHRDAGTTVTECRFPGTGGALMTKLGDVTPSDGFGRQERWVLVNPQATSGQVVCQMSGSTAWVIGVRAYQNVSQIMAAGDFGFVSATGTSTSPAVTIASAAGQLVEDAMSASLTSGQTASLPGGSGQTQQYNTTLAGQILGAGSTEPGAASVAMTWTLNASLPWASSAIKLLPSGPPDTVPPTDPTNLLCGAGATSSRLPCTWTASTDANPVSYRVEVSSGAACSGFTLHGTSATTSYTITGLPAATTRCVRVQATDGQNLSGFSNSATGATLATQHINLQWNDTNTSPNDTGTEVWFCEGASCDPTTAGTLLLTTGPNATTTSHTAAPNPSACYAVRALGAANPTSPYSNIKCVTAATGGAAILSVSPASLTFNASAGGANPAAQSLTIANTGTGTMSWSLSDTAPWLTCTPAAAADAAVTSCAVNIVGLASGTHNATITITAAGATGSPMTRPVTLILAPSVPGVATGLTVVQP